MLRSILKLTACLSFCAVLCSAQTLTPKWEDLTSADFVKAIQQADGVCLLPMGSLEKFGPSGPLGTNLHIVRLISLEAVKRQYAVVFPEYFAAGTSDASTLPGTIYYSTHMQLDLLDETTHEMARNGCKKILLVNGHSGNILFISLFLANFADTPHDYAVYYLYGDALPTSTSDWAKLPPASQPSKPGVDGHGGEERISVMLAYFPDLVHIDRAHDEPTSPGHGLEGPGGAPSPFQATQGFMSKLPSGYTGDASGATVARGKALVQLFVDRLVNTIEAVKADKDTLGVEKDFLKQVQNPRSPAPIK